MLEWLKTVLGDAYTDDVDKKVSEQIGKDFVARADFNQVNEAKKTLDGQIKDRDKQLEDLKKSSGDSEALKKQIADLQEANKTAKTEYDASLKKIAIDSKIEAALVGAKAHDVKAARALLDESKISLDGENVLGLADQVKALQKDKVWLFEQVETKSKGPGNPGAGGGAPGTGVEQGEMAKWRAEAGLPPEKS